MAEVDKDKEKIKGEEVKEDIKKMRYAAYKNHHLKHQRQITRGGVREDDLQRQGQIHPYVWPTQNAQQGTPYHYSQNPMR
jgi:hypothetical protein